MSVATKTAPAAPSQASTTAAPPAAAPLVSPIVAAFNGHRRTPPPINEPIRSYAPGTADRAELKARLESMSNEVVDIPIVIDGREIRTGDTANVVMPHAHQHVLGQWHAADVSHVAQAISAAERARADWGNWPFEERAGVFLRAAELLSTRYRATLNAATMLGQSKTAFQAEVDAACELADFWRFNVHFAENLYADQPISDKGIWNQTDYRPLEGFIYAVTPFNFTAIGGNLSTAPALMGNTVLWKPSATAMLSAHYIMEILKEAGLPPGVINFIPGDPIAISNAALSHRDFAGLHFTGSTTVFNLMWKQIGANTSSYRTYPRIVGETGGKDFIVAHHTADAEALAVAIIRGGFEYQGQKCSAASRVYVPQSLWGEVRDRVVAMMSEIKVGDVRDFRNFMGAVIDKRSFDKISGYLDDAKKNARIIAGGTTRGEAGYFVDPTLVEAKDAGYRLMCEEIFGPVVTAFVYPDAKFAEILDTVNTTSPYALTGSIFARDRAAVQMAMLKLRDAAGNFYINDKPTGAVVGQQPFGGARASGTNDKAGSMLNLARWVSARSVKETFAPPHDFRYPFMGAE
ncbi:MAG: L-glutamate gamma-semialdehyde dehydrogenase [Gemmatimonadaceae bacterium]|nr:L-glutamate gamma-semialdehyde dehydrogenase [Gemmatimonadaceae bacterium]